MRWLVLVLAACNPKTPADLPPNTASAFGVRVHAPSDVKVQQTARYAHVGNGTFKLNLFAVDQYSPTSAADQKARIERDLGVVKLTREDAGATTWRFDYELSNGHAATVARITPGRPLDCGVYDVAPEIAAAVAAACATASP